MSDTAVVAVAEPTAYPGDPIAQSIQDALDAQATPPVENSEEEVVEVPKADEPEVEEPTVDEPKEEGDEETPEGEPTDEVDEDYYPESADDLAAKWSNRAIPKYAIEQAAAWAAEAKAGHEITAKLGEPFIEPLAKMAEVMRSTDDDPNAYVPFLEAVVDMAGEDGLAKTLSHSLFVGLVKAPEWSDNPAMADFGKEIARRTDFFLEERFGLNAESITALGKLNADVSRLTIAADLDADGTLDKVLKWIDGEDDDLADILDEIEEVRAIRSNPVNKKLAAQAKAQADELAKLKTQPDKKPDVKVDDREVDNNFTQYLDQAVDNVLEELIPKDSPLKPFKGDSEDLKQAKAYHLAALADKMRAVIAKSPQRSTLLNGFRRQQQNTAVYRDNLVKLFGNEVVPAINADRKTAEQMIAKQYGKQRNAVIAKDLPKPTEQPVLEPTIPTNHAPANKIKTDREIEKDLMAVIG